MFDGKVPAIILLPYSLYGNGERLWKLNIIFFPVWQMAGWSHLPF